MASKFRNTGQTCVCANNIMVHEDVHDAFIAKLKETVERELKFGDAYNGATQGIRYLTCRRARKIIITVPAGRLTSSKLPGTYF